MASLFHNAIDVVICIYIVEQGPKPINKLTKHWRCIQYIDKVNRHLPLCNSYNKIGDEKLFPQSHQSGHLDITNSIC